MVNSKPKKRGLVTDSNAFAKKNRILCALFARPASRQDRNLFFVKVSVRNMYIDNVLDLLKLPNLTHRITVSNVLYHYKTLK